MGESAMTEIDELVYPNINDGVYRCGFAGSQEAYDTACTKLFDALDKDEALLGKQRYLCGDRLTLSDIRLVTTLLRFDIVYHTHFKCNKRRVVDYPNLWGYTREIYQMEGVSATFNPLETKKHYFGPIARSILWALWPKGRTITRHCSASPTAAIAPTIKIPEEGQLPLVYACVHF